MKSNNIKDAFFPVKLHYLYWGQPKREEDDEDVHRVPYNAQLCPRHYAVVNENAAYVYQCVTENYELVTNEDAVKAADAIAKDVFGKSSMMDFKHKIASFDCSYDARCYMCFWDADVFCNSVENDIWVPFVLVGNSYNSTAPLTYELGFCISNSDIFITFEETSIRIKDAHNKGILNRIEHIVRESVRRNKLDDLKAIQNDFILKMQTLNNAYLDESDVLPLSLKLFELDFHKDKDRYICINLYHALKHGRQSVFCKSNMYYYIRQIAEIIHTDNILTLQIASRLQFSMKFSTKIGELINKLVNYLNKRKPSDSLRTAFIGESYYIMASEIENHSY